MIILKPTMRIYKLVFILFLFIFGLFITSKDSYATNPLTVGYIIESSQMEGTMKSLDLVTGESVDQKDRPMLEMKFENATVQDLKIRKLVQTPKGLVTTSVKSSGPIFFKTLNVKFSNAENFQEVYLTDQGNLGLKGVNLLAHSITTDSTNLPQFEVVFNDGGDIEMMPKSEQELIELKAGLEQLIKSLERNMQQP